MRSHDNHEEPASRASSSRPVPSRPAPAAATMADHVHALQRSAGNAAVTGLVGRSPVLDVVGSGGGSPLDADTRADMEGRLGHDFGDVRIHTDSRAHESAVAVSADAYTVGSEIVFQRGRYDPSSGEGKKMLAHELTHVVQQRTGPVSGTPTGDGVSVSDPSDAFEREAVATAERVTAVARPMQPATKSTSQNAVSRSSTSIQRHSSFEHTLLGNTLPSRLSEAVSDLGDRAHLLEELWCQTIFFQKDVDADPRSRFSDVRWVQLRASGVWVSYGELNALPDYLANPESIDKSPREIVVPVLQRMRYETSKKVFSANFSEQASAGALEDISQSAAEVSALDGATKSLGENRYMGLLARNACHFAPFSWHRWAHFHQEARKHALAYHQTRSPACPPDHIDGRADSDARNAWLSNGYGDHFLQDSFAAGHLVNKTRVMQWFVDYVNELAPAWFGLLDTTGWPSSTKPWFGLPGDSVMSTMGSAQQPHIAGHDLYVLPDSTSETSWTDRRTGRGKTDSQSASERFNRENRIDGSGVISTGSYSREQNYRHYLDLLNNSYINFAAKEVHAWYNAIGSTVRNTRGDTFSIGGDDTLLSQSDPKGASIAAEAAQMSQSAIIELLSHGEAPYRVEDISALFPIAVLVTSGMISEFVPLERWNEEEVRRLCYWTLFPSVTKSRDGFLSRTLKRDLVPGGLFR